MAAPGAADPGVPPSPTPSPRGAPHGDGGGLSFTGGLQGPADVAARSSAGAAHAAAAAVAKLASLAPPKPLGSALLMRRPWALLLRVLLQLGISQASLLHR